MKKLICLCLVLLLFLYCKSTKEKIERHMEDGVEVIVNHLEPYKIANEPTRFYLEEKLTIDTEKEDICNARIAFENGCVANVTASRLALKTERKVRVFSRQAYLSLDYFKKTGTIIKADTNNMEVLEKISRGKLELFKAGWTDLVHREKLQIDDREPLRVEQESFLNAVVDKSFKPEATAGEGLAAMQCAQMILESIKQHKWQ